MRSTVYNGNYTGKYIKTCVYAHPHRFLQSFNRIHYNNDAASTFYLVVGTGTRTRTVASW